MTNSLSFEGVLTPHDMLRYLPFPFDVPPDTGAIRLRLQYTRIRTDQHKNLVTLGLFDPNGFRGQAHRGTPDLDAAVSASGATPGFVPGPIVPGRWVAELATHLIMPAPEPCRYTLSIELVPTHGDVHRNGLSRNLTAEAVTTNNVVKSQPGWYRGELHAHTQHSDGKLSVPQLLAEAKARGLDFISLNDHNTHSGWAELADADTDGLVVIPAIEFTTFHGHALAWGIDRWIDWRTGNDGWTMQDAASATRAAGGLFTIAHPNNLGVPNCTGCHWDDELDPALVDGIEIWNGTWSQPDAHNPDNLDWWQQLQDQGYSPVATCGCDMHSPQDWRPGVPFAFVYAQELSVPAILEGLRQRRVVVSCGPWLDLRATDGKASVGIGGKLVTRNSTIQLRATWNDAPAGARLRWLQGINLIAERAITADGTDQVNVEGAGRFHVELWDGEGSLLALTNPIHIHQESP